MIELTGFWSQEVGSLCSCGLSGPEIRRTGVRLEFTWSNLSKPFLHAGPLRGCLRCAMCCQNPTRAGLLCNY